MAENRGRPTRAVSEDGPAEDPSARILQLGSVIFLLCVVLLQVGEAERYQLILAVAGAGLGWLALGSQELTPPPPPLGAAALWLLYGTLHTLAGPTCGYAARAALARRGLQAGGLAVAMAMASSPNGLAVTRGSLLATGSIAGASALYERFSGGQGRSHWGGVGEESPRVGGLYGNPNLLGGVLALVLPLALLAVAEATTAPGRLLAAGALLLVSGGLGATYSRSSWVAACAGVGALFWLSANRKRLAGAALGALVVLALAAPGASSRAASTLDPTSFGISQRLAVLKGVAGMAAAAPVRGHGLGSFPAAFPKFRVLGGQYPIDAHCQYLQEIVESGVLGGGLFFLVLAGAIAVAARRRQAPNTPDRIDLEAAFVGSLTWMAFASPLSYTPLAMPWVFVLGAVSAPTLEASGNRLRPGQGGAARWVLGLGLAFTVVSAIGVARSAGPRMVARAGIAGVRGIAGEPGSIAAVETVATDLFQALREAEARDPGAPGDSLLRGRLLLGLGRLEAAETAFQDTLVRDRGEAWAWRGMAEVELARGEPERAIEDLDRALALDPSSEDTMRQKAEILVRLGRLQDAQGLLEAALRTNPAFLRINRDTYPRVMLRLIQVLERRGKSEEAAELRATFLEYYGDDLRR